MLVSHSRLLGSHFILPICIAGLAFFASYHYHVNVFIADYIYHWQGDSWALKDHWLLEYVIHLGGRLFIEIMYGTVAILFIATWFNKIVKPLRKGLLYLLVAVLLSSLIVAIVKSFTGVACPWRVERYGGWATMDFFVSNGKCFPAGHAGGGYAWMALYFFCRVYFPRWRFLGLLLGLFLGVVFGVAQQLRGAHFISHDIASLAICWSVAFILYSGMWRKKKCI
jgi:membrane-associated PAP2 superfamily phosphatase